MTVDDAAEDIEEAETEHESAVRKDLLRAVRTHQFLAPVSDILRDLNEIHRYGHTADSLLEEFDDFQEEFIRQAEKFFDIARRYCRKSVELHEELSEGVHRATVDDPSVYIGTQSIRDSLQQARPLLAQSASALRTTEEVLSEKGWETNLQNDGLAITRKRNKGKKTVFSLVVEKLYEHHYYNAGPSRGRHTQEMRDMISIHLEEYFDSDLLGREPKDRIGRAITNFIAEQQRILEVS